MRFSLSGVATKATSTAIRIRSRKRLMTRNQLKTLMNGFRGDETSKGPSSRRVNFLRKWRAQCKALKSSVEGILTVTAGLPEQAWLYLIQVDHEKSPLRVKR